MISHARPSHAPRAWAPPPVDQWEGGGHVLHHRRDWSFRTLEEARRELEPWLGAHRFAIVDTSGDAFMVTRDVPTLHDEVVSCLACEAEDVAIARLAEAWDGLRELRGRAVVRTTTVACVEGRWVDLGIGLAVPPTATPGWTSALRDRVMAQRIWPELWQL
ncbi:MAG: hypothetical protein KF901_27035 [Myxococcales bacterium]|nr:hypothetical protein [Myxococcales bacterium]